MIPKWLAIYVIFYKVNSFGSNGELWDKIVSNKSNLDNSRLSRQKSSKSYIYNPLISTVEIPASVFPDVTYPTSIMDTREPYYFTTNTFDDVLKPFSDDVKTSYKALKSGKIRSASLNHSPQNSNSINHTLVTANASINTCNELEESEDTGCGKDRLLSIDLVNRGESILNYGSVGFDDNEIEAISSTNVTENLLNTEILGQDIKKTKENLTSLYLNKLPSMYSNEGIIEEIHSEENVDIQTEFPNKLNEAKNIFNTILTTLQNFQKKGTYLSDSQPHNDYDDTSLVTPFMNNQIEITYNTKKEYELNLNSIDHEKCDLKNRNVSDNLNVLIKELNTTEITDVTNNKTSCKPLEGNTTLSIEKDVREDSSSSSDEKECIHIYVANENTSDYEVIEILIDNSEELNIRSGASSLSIFDF